MRGSANCPQLPQTPASRRSERKARNLTPHLLQRDFWRAYRHVQRVTNFHCPVKCGGQLLRLSVLDLMLRKSVKMITLSVSPAQHSDNMREVPCLEPISFSMASLVKVSTISSWSPVDWLI